MTGFSSILQPLSSELSRRKPPDVDNTTPRRPSPRTAASSDSPSRLVTQPYASTAEQQTPSTRQPVSQTRDSENVNTSHVKSNRLSIANLARDKTNTALANLSLRQKTSSHSLRSSSSSNGSNSKQAPSSTVDKATTSPTTAASNQSYTIAEKRPAQPTHVTNPRQFGEQPPRPSFQRASLSSLSQDRQRILDRSFAQARSTPPPGSEHGNVNK